jgi:hypothetical protein
LAIDLKLNLEEHDLDISSYDLALVDRLEQIQQKLQIKLKFFSQEWFLDTSVGLPLYELVFVKNPDLDLIASAFKSEILSVEGVNNILEYEQEFDSAARSLEITFKVDTIYGTLTDTVEVA